MCRSRCAGLCRCLLRHGGQGDPQAFASAGRSKNVKHLTHLLDRNLAHDLQHLAALHMPEGHEVSSYGAGLAQNGRSSSSSGSELEPVSPSILFRSTSSPLNRWITTSVEYF